MSSQFTFGRGNGIREDAAEVEQAAVVEQVAEAAVVEPVAEAAVDEQVAEAAVVEQAAEVVDVEQAVEADETVEATEAPAEVSTPSVEPTTTAVVSASTGVASTSKKRSAIRSSTVASKKQKRVSMTTPVTRVELGIIEPTEMINSYKSLLEISGESKREFEQTYCALMPFDAETAVYHNYPVYREHFSVLANILYIKFASKMMADQRDVDFLSGIPSNKDNVHGYLAKMNASVMSYVNESRTDNLINDMCVRRMYDEIAKYDNLGRFPCAEVDALNTTMNNVLKECDASLLANTDSFDSISIINLFQ